MFETFTPEQRRLTVQQVAELLGYHPQTIYRWARLGVIPCIRRRHTLRFNLEDIRRWEARATTGKL